MHVYFVLCRAKQLLAQKNRHERSVLTNTLDDLEMKVREMLMTLGYINVYMYGYLLGWCCRWLMFLYFLYFPFVFVFVFVLLLMVAAY